MSENDIDLLKDNQQNDSRLRTRITNRASLISPRLNSPITFNRLNNPSSILCLRQSFKKNLNL